MMSLSRFSFLQCSGELWPSNFAKALAEQSSLMLWWLSYPPTRLHACKVNQELIPEDLLQRTSSQLSFPNCCTFLCFADGKQLHKMQQIQTWGSGHSKLWWTIGPLFTNGQSFCGPTAPNTSPTEPVSHAFQDRGNTPNSTQDKQNKKYKTRIFL